MRQTTIKHIMLNKSALQLKTCLKCTFIALFSFFQKQHLNMYQHKGTSGTQCACAILVYLRMRSKSRHLGFTAHAHQNPPSWFLQRMRIGSRHLVFFCTCALEAGILLNVQVLVEGPGNELGEQDLTPAVLVFKFKAKQHNVFLRLVVDVSIPPTTKKVTL